MGLCFRPTRKGSHSTRIRYGHARCSTIRMNSGEWSKKPAKSTDLQSPEDVGHLTDKTRAKAEEWARVADEIILKNVSH